MGVWVIELEIFVMLYMLNVDIYIYFDKKWFQYSGGEFNFELVEEREVIYLYYRQQNYYDVVLSVLVNFF